jgi:hypothetical protein
MADWKQITARIRRARTSKEPAAQLSNLFEKTRDAMVAFELAKYFETSGQNADAAKWYTTAAERFRRADWKTKAQEAAVRLGGELSVAAAQEISETSHDAGHDTSDDTSDDNFPPATPPLTVPEPGLPFEQNAEALESIVAVSSEVQAASNGSTGAGPAADADRRPRRRGRRGGRNRRRQAPSAQPSAAPSTRTQETPPARRGQPAAASSEVSEPTSARASQGRSMPQLPVEPIGDPAGPSVKGRYGDPGLSSRLTVLEMQFRRLMTCPPVNLNEVDKAPAGPGVFVLTDSELTSYYYVEACQTLRIAVGNLLRGGASHRSADSIKPRLAEHLGIPETRVAKYLAEHCAVRWLQLDEGASHFAHFVVAVLRPSLNE